MVVAIHSPHLCLLLNHKSWNPNTLTNGPQTFTECYFLISSPWSAISYFSWLCKAHDHGWQLECKLTCPSTLMSLDWILCIAWSHQVQIHRDPWTDSFSTLQAISHSFHTWICASQTKKPAVLMPCWFLSAHSGFPCASQAWKASLCCCPSAASAPFCLIVFYRNVNVILHIYISTVRLSSL